MNTKGQGDLFLEPTRHPEGPGELWDANQNNTTQSFCLRESQGPQQLSYLNGANELPRFRAVQLQD